MKCENCGSTKHEKCSQKVPSKGDLAGKVAKMMKGKEEEKRK